MYYNGEYCNCIATSLIFIEKSLELSNSLDRKTRFYPKAKDSIALIPIALSPTGPLLWWTPARTTRNVKKILSLTAIITGVAHEIGSL